jgi:hypothetical protein
VKRNSVISAKVRARTLSRFARDATLRCTWGMTSVSARRDYVIALHMLVGQ